MSWQLVNAKKKASSKGYKNSGVLQVLRYAAVCALPLHQSLFCCQL